MDTTRICISKKVTYLSIFILLVLGYVTFTYLTLRSKQATNSKAQLSNMTTIQFDRVSPDQALYKNYGPNLYYYQPTPTYLVGSGELLLTFSDADYKAVTSTNSISQTKDKDVYVISKRSLENSDDEELISQITGTELTDSFDANHAISVKNVPNLDLTKSEIIFFKLPQ